MKEYVQILIAFAVILALIPCIGYIKKSAYYTNADTETESSAVTILFTDSGEIEELSMKEYIIGSVFAQMPADFEEEALKAQAVLAHTYAERRILTEKNDPTEELEGAVLSDDSSLYQAYFTEEQAKAAYGDEYDEAYEKISSAAEYAENLCLTYKGEPILVAFHGISFGKTESALDMWGEDIPYLKSADSAADLELSSCVSVYEINESELKQLLLQEYPEEVLDGPAEDWLMVGEMTENETALKIKIGNGLYDASDFCSLLSLSSQHFTIEYDSGMFVFTVQGCGHLVGMSQYGANEMAESGKSCEEILLHYFSGTSLLKN